MRANGVVADPRSLQHDHVGWAAPDTDSLASVVGQAFRGADPSERLILICDDPTRGHLADLPGRDHMVTHGQLLVADTHDVYRPVTDLDAEFDALAQLAEFDALVDQAFADGFSSIRVVAENTRMMQGDDTTVRRWLAWEQVTDQWQAHRPVTGTCFFDRSQLDPHRLDAVLGLHPKVNDPQLPRLQVFTDGDALVLRGSVEVFDDLRLRDVVELAARAGDVVLEVSGLAYLHHRPLLRLGALAASGVRVQVRNASPLIQRLRSAMAAETAHVEWVAAH